MRSANAFAALFVLTLPAIAAAQQTSWPPAPSTTAQPGATRLDDAYVAAQRSDDRVFALRKMADEAEQLQRLCSTKFGPPELCGLPPQSQDASAKATTVVPPSTSGTTLTEQWSLSLVGWEEAPTAWLRAPGAVEQRRAVKGSVIAGWTVDVVAHDRVNLSRTMRNADGAPLLDDKNRERRETMTLLPTRTAAPPPVTSISGYVGGAAATAPARAAPQPPPTPSLLQQPTRVAPGVR